MNFCQPRSVILVDDDADFREALLERLRLEDLDVQAFASAEAALNAVGVDYPGIVVSDLRMPGMDGRGLLERLQALDEGLPVVMITGHGDIADAVDAIRSGAYDFVAKPFDFDRLFGTLSRALEKRGLVLDNRSLAAAVVRTNPDLPLLGASPAIARLRAAIEQVADGRMDVLIEGETGVGKEVVARALHNSGRRRVHPFIAVNCGALSADLVESELFGHEPGAFPGAVKRRFGLIEQSHRGTLFLDEVESMSATAQVALLRVIEHREVRPLGASGARQLDLRVFASSKGDLRLAVERGDFREDLYYRLNVVKLRVPPLRERREDVPLLFAHFLARAVGDSGITAPPMSTVVRRMLLEHDWPGNVRELEHYAQRIALDLNAPGEMGDAKGQDLGLTDRVEHFEKAVIEEALERYAGDIVAITEALRLPRKTLYDKFRRHGLTPAQFRR